MTDDTIRIEVTEQEARQMFDMLNYCITDDAPYARDTMSERVTNIVAESIDGNRGSAFDWYQEFTDETAVYPSGKSADERLPEVGVLYCALGLNGEAGEVAEKVKKHIRGDDNEPLDIGDELGDVLWYLARLAEEMDYDFDAIARRNASKLTDRKKRDVLKGSGDNR